LIHAKGARIVTPLSSAESGDIVFTHHHMLAFSTCWNSARLRDGEEMAREILEMGFDTIELGHGLQAPAVASLLRAQEKMGFRVSSVHNFCPLPPEVMTDHPDCYEFTSHREEDRRRAVRLTRQTIDMAERFGARFVVIHAGRVRTLSYTGQLRKLMEEGHVRNKAFGRIKLEAVQKREEVGETYVQRALDCLAEIADYAGEKGITLGIENRDDYEAVPSEREMANFLRRLDSKNAVYWHDFGHAQIKHNLSLLSHEQWLDKMGAQVGGCHVHDVKWPFSDHQAPFTGEVKFEELVPKLPKECLFVFEMNPRVPKEQVLAAAERWRTTFSQ